MIADIEKVALILIPLLLYFFRLERKITSMATDIDWIKGFCLQSITNPAPSRDNPGARDLST